MAKLCVFATLLSSPYSITASPSGADIHHANLRQTHVRINPVLDPRSSKKFFGKDYPDDGRPDVAGLKKGGFHDFTPPFPAVQGSDDFDKDYVKDENKDNGEWHAQANYDRIKLEWRKAKDALNAAQKKEDGIAGEAHAADLKAQDAHGKAAGSKAGSEKAAKWRAQQEREEKAAEEKAAAERAAAGNTTKNQVPSGPVEAAQWELDKEQKEFEKCKEELEAAKQHLKDVQEALEKKKAEQKKKDEEAQAQADKDAADAEGKVAEDKKAVDAAAGEKDADEKAAADAEGAAGADQKAADAEKSKYDRGEMSVKEAQAKLDAANEELKKAEHKLKMFRGELPVAPAEPEHHEEPGFFANLFAKLR